MKTSLPKFQRIFYLPKMAAIFNFFKSACIWKTVLDRAILTKNFTCRVTLLSSSPNFQKNFVLSKMVAILNFSEKLQNTKNACISRNGAKYRAISPKFFIHRGFVKTSLLSFKEFFTHQKRRPFGIPNFFQKCLYLENHAR